MIILIPIAHLFNTNHESFVGSINDPEDGPAYVLPNLFSFSFMKYTNITQGCAYRVHSCSGLSRFLRLLWIPGVLRQQEAFHSTALMHGEPKRDIILGQVSIADTYTRINNFHSRIYNFLSLTAGMLCTIVVVIP